MGSRGVAVVLAGSVSLAACTTTDTLGRFDDPAERARVQDIIAHETTYAEVTGVVSQYNGLHRVVGVTSGGLQVELYPHATPVVVPGAQLRFLSTYDHLRGAGEGALALGIPAFVVGGLLGFVFYSFASSCGPLGGCGHTDSSAGLKVGLALGLGGTAFGAGIGALAGHEHRYIPDEAPRESLDRGR